MRKKVLLVDDHPAMLWALKNMLAQQVHFEIIGEAVDGDGCLEFVRENDTDLIILDIDMPKIDGFDAVSYTHLTLPTT
jgi:two-component system response regulator EvgA